MFLLQKLKKWSNLLEFKTEKWNPVCDHRLSLHNFQVTINASTDCFSTADRMEEQLSTPFKDQKQATLNTDSDTLYEQLPLPPPPK